MKLDALVIVIISPRAVEVAYYKEEQSVGEEVGDLACRCRAV